MLTDEAPATAASATSNTIIGTPGNDYMLDTAANDTMLGGDGNDVFHMSWGSDDFVDGQGGDYNQVDFVGKSSDYTFSKAADGSEIVKTSVGETDTLRNIDGVYFYGDNKWVLVDDLVSTDGGTVSGTPGDDYLLDTAANDITLGGGGNDAVLGSPGDDIFHGGAGFDSGVYDGKSTDYVVTKGSDGAYFVSNPATGHDTLYDAEMLSFDGEPASFLIDGLVQDEPMVMNHDMAM